MEFGKFKVAVAALGLSAGVAINQPALAQTPEPMTQAQTLNEKARQRDAIFSRMLSKIQNTVPGTLSFSQNGILGLKGFKYNDSSTGNSIDFWSKNPRELTMVYEKNPAIQIVFTFNYPDQGPVIEMSAALKGVEQFKGIRYELGADPSKDFADSSYKHTYVFTKALIEAQLLPKIGEKRIEK